jgi:type I restriction enzyme, S subunit
MSKGAKNMLVPKLRFPEFSQEEEWTETALQDKFDFQDGYPFSSTQFSNSPNNATQVIRITDINNQNKNDEKVYVTDALIQDLQLHKYLVKKGDLLLSLTGAAGFNFFFWNSKEALINQRTLRIFPKEEDDFALPLLLEPSVYAKINALGSGQNNNLSKESLKEIRAFFPKPKEQQKIADCLSTLDEYLTAQRDKLETLKAHKKGLMQQLFPAEGETVPKLRFAEFKNSGAWVELPLGKAAEIITGNTPPTNDASNYGGDKLFVSPSDISERRYITNTKTTLSDKGYSETRHIKENSVLFVCIGSTIGKVAQNKYECSTNQQINSLVTYEGYSSDFLYSALEYQASSIATIAGIQAVPIINKSLFSSVLVSFPSPEEQQKIADCLSSLDELITAQSEKIEALKVHKKGLMQQLFPNTKEASI